MKKIRVVTGILCFCLCATLPTGCGVVDRGLDAIDQAISNIDKSVTAVQRESGAWRNELPQLTEGLISAAQKAQAQGTADAEKIITSATNSVRSLAEDTIKLSGLTAEELVANFGTEVRCNLDFTRARVSASLGQLSEALKFWKSNKTLPRHRPTQSVN